MPHHRVGEADTGLACLDRAEALVPDDPELLAVYASRRAGLLVHLHRAEAEAELGRALGLCRASGLRLEEGIILGNLGQLARQHGDWRTAESRYHEALDVFAELGDAHQLAMVQAALAVVAIEEGRYDEAEHRNLEAIEVFRRLERRLNEATTVGNLGEVRRRRGELERAVDALEASVERLRALGERGHLSVSLAMLGEAELERGRPREALRHLEEAQRLGRLSGFHWVVEHTEPLRLRIQTGRSA